MKVAFHIGEPPTFEGFSPSFWLFSRIGLCLKLCSQHRLNVFVKSDIPYSLNSLQLTRAFFLFQEKNSLDFQWGKCVK